MLDQADRLADAVAVPMQELVAPLAIRDRLEGIDNEKPTEADYAAAVSAIDGDLDRAAQAARRIEQSYLRRALFSGPIAPCDLCGRAFEVEFLVAAHIKKRAECSDPERRDVAHVVMSACRFGCDELSERGYISVGDNICAALLMADSPWPGAQNDFSARFAGCRICCPTA